MKYSLLQVIMDMIYPVRCPVCRKIVNSNKEWICGACKEKLQYIHEPRCKKCSKPILAEEKEFCNDCEHKNYHFNRGFALWVYDEAMRRSLADFKYHNKKENAKFYVRELLARYSKQIEKISPDAIVPIPIHKSKYRERGYNQAEILAEGLGKGLGIPVISNLLIRNRKTLPQKQLSDKERLKNLKEAFTLNTRVLEELSGKVHKILLVDDIYTTGSTIEACTNVLIQHGINEVFFITVCIGKGY